MKADYPLPTPDEVMSKLQGGTLFSTLDMTQAYQQLRVTETTAQQLTINTVKGLYKVKLLPFGIAAAPAIFQRFVEKLLAGIDGIAVYLDDIIISGADQQQHNRRLETVLARLEESGLRLKKPKCKSARTEVEFLGHKITGLGVRPTDAKIRALLKAPEPTSKETLQSFLGMLAFYDRFLKDGATTAAPIYKLLAKNATWKWTREHKTAFDALKEQICHAPVLAHYDPHRPLILSCDASPYGVGAVLAQEDNEGNERPVAFASRTLGPAERNYSQLDKEGLAIVYAVVHFHMYLAGRHVQIYTDHKPLLGIPGTTKPVPQLTSPRMLRWCVKPAAYTYDLSYRPGKLNSNADILSRLPLPSTDDEPCHQADVLMFEALSRPPLTAEEISSATQSDPVLSEVYTAIEAGTLYELRDAQFRQFRARVTEFSFHRGCILRGSRVVIPQSKKKSGKAGVRVGARWSPWHRGYESLCSELHVVVWYRQRHRGDGQDVHQLRKNQKSPAKVLQPEWTRPSTPWHTIHLDFAGPIRGITFLVIVDAYSKWMGVRQVESPNSATVIRVLRGLFATFGIPQKAVSDNGTAFVSEEMKEFYRRNGVKCVTAAPYHPATNGQAERMVGYFKRTLSKATSGTLATQVSRILFKQHTTCHATTRKTPARLMFGRELPSALDGLLPKRHTSQLDRLPESRTLHEGDVVLIRNFSSKPTWVQGDVTRRVGRRSWMVRTEDGECRRHIDHIRLLRRKAQLLDTGTSPLLAWNIGDTEDQVTRNEETSSVPPPLEGRPKRRYRELFWKARSKAKESHYRFIWVKNGRIFVRKAEGEMVIRIANAADLENIV
ncbi:uncharacterized protein K02A2.6-like [Ornithodoros turicata]|uniref:uncharacterized protein K02A2.6-like n=1 Tax=Ornithodoros turicata TaxID=34597 RepID=UPI00313999E2